MKLYLIPTDVAAVKNSVLLTGKIDEQLWLKQFSFTFYLTGEKLSFPLFKKQGYIFLKNKSYIFAQMLPSNIL